MSDTDDFRRYDSPARLAAAQGGRMTFGERKRITTHIDADLLEDSKRRALQRRISLAALVRLALRTEIEGR